MNRRAFLGAIGLAPVAAVAAVAAPAPAYASGGPVRGSARYAVVGEIGPEAIMPLKRVEGISVANTVNVLDPSKVAEYLTAEEAERIIRNIVRRMK